MKRSGFLLLGSVLALGACDNTDVAKAPDGVPPPAVTAPAEAPAPAVPLVPVDVKDAQVRAQAFRAAWGKGAPVHFKAKEEDEDQTYTKSRLVALSPGLYALVSEGMGGEGHASSGSLAIHYLQQVADGFELKGAWPALIYSGTWGAPPAWEIRTDLMPEPTLVAAAGGTWQGYSCDWAHVIELTPEKPIIRIDQIATGYSDGGARIDGEKETSLKGEILPGQKGRTIQVRYSGDRKATVTYAKVGDTYDAVDPPELPSC